MTTETQDPPPAVEFRHIRTAAIRPSASNPRRTFGDMEDLVESVRAHGVQQPVLCRPMDGGDGTYELVFGERRLRAAVRAEVAYVPAMIREMTDREVLEAQIAENLHREDVHPIEEAEAYERLRDVYDLTVEHIAAKVGKSPGYVYARIKLLALCETARVAYAEGRLTASTALYVARIPDATLQAEAVEEIGGNEHDGPMTARAAAKFIHDNYMLRLAAAPFDTTDGALVPDRPACGACPHRTGAEPSLFEDVADADVCTLPPCYQSKVDTAHAAAAEKAKREHGVNELKRGRGRDAVYPGWANSEDPQHGSGYAVLSQTHYDHATGKQVSWKKLVGKETVTPSAVTQAPSGRMVVLYKTADLEAAAKRAGTIKGPGRSSPSAESKRARQESLVSCEIQRRVAVEIERRSAAMLDTEEGLWHALLRALIPQCWADTLKSVARRRGLAVNGNHAPPTDALLDLAASLPPGGARALLFEILATRDAGGFANRTGAPSFRAIIDLCGIDLPEIEIAVRAEMRDRKAGKKAAAKAEKPKAPAKKAAKAAKKPAAKKAAKKGGKGKKPRAAAASKSIAKARSRWKDMTEEQKKARVREMIGRTAIKPRGAKG